jgi:Domain of unknown function (DUF1844)
MPEKKNAFVVSDKRKFTAEGELRPEAKSEEEPPRASSTATAPPTKPEAPAPKPEAPARPSGPEHGQRMPQPPSAAEQQSQQDAYRDSGKKFERNAFRGRTPQDYEMTFERLVASLYMSAMMQLGLMHEEGQQPVADLIGAKQTIDTLGVLQEKTKGNLTEQEQSLLQNALYELRMAFVELTNAVARQAPPDLSGSGKAK